MNEPARWGLRRRLLDVLDRLGLARPAVRAYELSLAARSNLRRGRTNEGVSLPIPPASLRAQIGPRHADTAFFLRSGQEHAELVRNLLSEQGASMEELDAILDWGCGCGRVMRHWSSLTRTRVFGCDINPRMVGWCDANLAFAEVSVTALEPPMRYEESSFDLIYAFSVFTHLSEELQHEWIRECLRVLKPGGYLMLSTMGEYYLTLQRLDDSERAAFADGKLVVLYEGAAGTSLCSAYHPPSYVHGQLASEFDVVAFRPAVEGGRHDVHLLRKPAEAHVPAERS
jgi:SAM-dependent methyltransferase